MSLKASLGNFGPVFITVAMILFAFTTLLGNLYYVDQSLFFMMKNKPSKGILSIYYILASLVIFIGAGLSADLLWSIADITMGVMALINIPVIIILGKYVTKALKDYEKKIKEGKDPEFKVEDINLTHQVDCWK
jgi:AGCS family alanine or glycine:cation symporter